MGLDTRHLQQNRGLRKSTRTLSLGRADGDIGIEITFERFLPSSLQPFASSCQMVFCPRYAIRLARQEESLNRKLAVTAELSF